MVVLACLFSANLCASEITATWNGQPGFWSNSSQWSCGGCAYPNNTGGNIFDVTIASFAANVFIDVPLSINSLVLGVATPSLTSELVLTNTTMNVLGSAGTTVNAAGFLNIGTNDNGQLNTPTLTNAGNVFVGPGSTLNGGASVSNSGTSYGLQVSGYLLSFTLTNTGLMEEGLDNGSANRQPAQIQATNLINSGTINTTAVVSGTGVSSNFLAVGTLTNQLGGNLNINGAGDIAKAVQLLNYGSTTIGQFSSLTVADGIMDVPAGSALNVYGSLVTNPSGVFGLGKLSSIEGLLVLGGIAGGTIVPSGGTLVVASSGTLNLQGPTVTVAGGVANSGTVVSAQAGDPGHTFAVNGVFQNNPTGTLTLAQSGATATLGSLFNEGTVTVAHGATLNDSLNNAGAETIYGTQNVSGGSPALTNTGLIQEGNGALIAVTGNALNSGTFTTTQAGQTAGNTLTVSGALVNLLDGVVNVNGSQDLVSAAELVNAGQINLTLGEVFVGSGAAPALAAGLAEYYQNSGAVFDEIFSDDSTFGIMAVDGSVFLNDGTLKVELPSGFAPSIGQKYEILTFTSGDLNGEFNFTSPIFDNGAESFTIDYDNIDGYISLTVTSFSGSPVPEPGSLPATLAGLIALACGVLSRARHR